MIVVGRKQNGKQLTAKIVSVSYGWLKEKFIELVLCVFTFSRKNSLEEKRFYFFIFIILSISKNFIHTVERNSE